jgi:tRNA A-37 threonylcarbamoyl transferase component Bud32
MMQPDFPLQRKGGVTFGALVDELENIRVWSERQKQDLTPLRRSRRLEEEEEASERRERERRMRAERERFLYATKHLGIQVEGVVATDEREVQIAHRAIERARLYDKLKAYKDEPFFTFLVGEPHV